MMTNYNDGKWHGWNGESMKPASVHDKSVVEYVWHDAHQNSFGKSERVAGCDEFDVSPAWSNTLKFRVTKEHKEPREFWVSPESGRCFTNKPIAYTAIHVREVTE